MCSCMLSDIAERALKVLQGEAQRHSAVRSQLASIEGLQAAALFQEGLREPLTPGQPPCIGLPLSLPLLAVLQISQIDGSAC